jgi:hypothetical protein
MKEGLRAYVYDIDGKRHYGTVHRNVGHEHISEWYIQCDDGEDYAILEDSTVYPVDEDEK